MGGGSQKTKIKLKVWYIYFVQAGISQDSPCVTKGKPINMQKRVLCLFLGISFFSLTEAQSRQLSVGDTIPSFSLKDQDGKDFTVKEHIGKNTMVIYFYPKDESAVCTKEACAFRDSYADFTNAGALVIGINSGSIESHRSFQHNEVLKLFGVKGKFVFTGRETYLVDLNGKIVYSYSSFTNGSAHAEKTLAFIETMKKN
jgi:thioredoxin-dependent peroxiredoxin